MISTVKQIEQQKSPPISDRHMSIGFFNFCLIVPIPRATSNFGSKPRSTFEWKLFQTITRTFLSNLLQITIGKQTLRMHIQCHPWQNRDTSIKHVCNDSNFQASWRVSRVWHFVFSFWSTPLCPLTNRNSFMHSCE